MKKELITEEKALEALKLLKKYLRQEYGGDICKEPTQNCGLCQANTLYSYLNWQEEYMWQTELNQEINH